MPNMYKSYIENFTVYSVRSVSRKKRMKASYTDPKYKMSN